MEKKKHYLEKICNENIFHFKNIKMSEQNMVYRNRKFIKEKR